MHEIFSFCFLYVISVKNNDLIIVPFDSFFLHRVYCSKLNILIIVIIIEKKVDFSKHDEG